jgi:hypothetical protein
MSRENSASVGRQPAVSPRVPRLRLRNLESRDRQKTKHPPADNAGGSPVSSIDRLSRLKRELAKRAVQDTTPHALFKICTDRRLRAPPAKNPPPSLFFSPTPGASLTPNSFFGYSQSTTRRLLRAGHRNTSLSSHLRHYVLRCRRSVME